MSKTGQINHIEIYVSNLKNTRLFWDTLLLENLNYKIYQEWPNGISYKLDETYLVFVQSNKTIPEYNRTRVGLNHLAFLVLTTKQVDKIRSQLLASNYNELYANLYPHAGGAESYALYIEDPDRIKVEIVCKQ
ncbi:VOC family protein [Weissella bombi]|uniref:Catechol 2,3-dioxygenase n=1 Tax=Weissella bombi TaxID=1505725 RepID=A0A1C4B8L2_9LACO|nr:VOC family protein [Weissella bombi]SCC03134.1 Catechol 2,3-dioxygenase [Weissella bombi]